MVESECLLRVWFKKEVLLAKVTFVSMFGISTLRDSYIHNYRTQDFNFNEKVTTSPVAEYIDVPG